jgi:hypothetical protein
MDCHRDYRPEVTDSPSSKQPGCNDRALLPKQRVLITESSAGFDAVRTALEQEIRPRGIIERMYVNDISSIVWEMLRLRRCKTAIINMGFRAALENLLSQLLKNDLTCNQDFLAERTQFST